MCLPGRKEAGVLRGKVAFDFTDFGDVAGNFMPSTVVCFAHSCMLCRVRGIEKRLWCCAVNSSFSLYCRCCHLVVPHTINQGSGTQCDIKFNHTRAAIAHRARCTVIHPSHSGQHVRSTSIDDIDYLKRYNIELDTLRLRLRPH